MTTTDTTMDAITHAVELGRAGQPGDARTALLAIWDSFGPQGDPLHRCTLAHYLADLHDDPAEALAWDIRALDAADSLTDSRAQQYHPSLRVGGFYPSLHLNLADNYRRLGSFDAARREIEATRSALPELPDGPYRTMIRTAFDEVEAAVQARDTARRPSAPTGRPD
ncbi:hypothetical protein F5X71_25240 [Nocardia brasiliensis]|uniref:Tetratricopeptide repeat protein n=1 Tax=Nocardia brasiliensis TaxID=37326 RepID=A0A6G9XWA3_NOCBR|nr:hypothetical protein [Nocardia brasiliensis]QIS05176.1 hypothetical protein F5X71_25240 [Nocardia brasiliensis]